MKTTRLTRELWVTATTIVLSLVIVIGVQRSPMETSTLNNPIGNEPAGLLLAGAAPVKTIKPKPTGETIQIPAKRVVKRVA